MDKNFDTIRFELFDPYEAKEQWPLIYIAPVIMR